MTVLYVNADWSAIVPAGSVEAAFGIDEETAQRLGLLKAPEPLPEAETIHPAKQAAKPADKAAKKPADK